MQSKRKRKQSSLYFMKSTIFASISHKYNNNNIIANNNNIFNLILFLPCITARKSCISIIKNKIPINYQDYMQKEVLRKWQIQPKEKMMKTATPLLVEGMASLWNYKSVLLTNIIDKLVITCLHKACYLSNVWNFISVNNWVYKTLIL